MLRTQMDAIHPHCYPFLIVRFFSLQFSNIECLWVGWYHISSVLGIWLWPNQKHKRTQISTGTNDPIPWPHISSLLQPVMNRANFRLAKLKILIPDFRYVKGRTFNKIMNISCNFLQNSYLLTDFKLPKLFYFYFSSYWLRHFPPVYFFEEKFDQYTG